MKHLMPVMVAGQKHRDQHDFFATPPEATVALVRLLGDKLSNRDYWSPTDVWEPACGDGAISRVLEKHGFGVVSTDLVDRGYGRGDVDFLQTNELLAPNVVTNPPFKLSEPFVRHAIGLGAQVVAMLLKATWWSAASRFPLFVEHRPRIVAPLTWRLDFTGQDKPIMECAWVVWGGRPETTLYLPLLKPRPEGTEHWPASLVGCL